MVIKVSIWYVVVANDVVVRGVVRFVNCCVQSGLTRRRDCEVGKRGEGGIQGMYMWCV